MMSDCGEDQDSRGKNEGEGIVDGDAIEEGFEIAAEKPGYSDAERGAEGGGEEGFAQDHADQLPGRCTEGHADADFFGALGGSVGDDTVDASNAEDETEGSE